MVTSVDDHQAQPASARAAVLPKEAMSTVLDVGLHQDHCAEWRDRSPAAHVLPWDWTSAPTRSCCRTTRPTTSPSGASW